MHADVQRQIQALERQVQDALKLKDRPVDWPNLKVWQTQTEILMERAEGDDSIALKRFRELTFTRTTPVTVRRNGTTIPSQRDLTRMREQAYRDDLGIAAGIIQAVVQNLTSELPSNAITETGTFAEIRSTLEDLRFLKATKTLVLADLEEAAKAYQNTAYKACVIMCGAVMEGLLLGHLERARNIRLLWDSGRLTNSTTLKSARRNLQKSSLENLINLTQKSNCMSGFTDEIAKMVQRCRNSIHPGRVLRGGEVLDAFDKKAADLALNFLNVLCSCIAKD